MIVEILFKDLSILTIENVKKVSNASTNIPNDWLYVYTYGDLDGHPSFKHKMYNIVCVQVKEK